MNEDIEYRWERMYGTGERRLPYGECPNCGKFEYTKERTPIYMRVMTKKSIFGFEFFWDFDRVKIGWRTYEFCSNCSLQTEEVIERRDGYEKFFEKEDGELVPKRKVSRNKYEELKKAFG